MYSTQEDDSPATRTQPDPDLWMRSCLSRALSPYSAVLMTSLPDRSLSGFWHWPQTAMTRSRYTSARLAVTLNPAM